MSLIICPSCGAEQVDPSGLRSAESFCVECDFPLFFSGPDLELARSDTSESRDRLPGVDGRTPKSWRSCGECGELNRRASSHGLRCGAVLREVIDHEDEVEQQGETLPEEDSAVAPAKKSSGLIEGLIAGLLVGLLLAYFVTALWLDNKNVENGIDLVVSEQEIELVEAGSIVTVTVSLSEEPIKEIVIETSSNDPNVALVSPKRLVFNARNWNSPKNVKIEAPTVPISSNQETLVVLVPIENGGARRLITNNNRSELPLAYELQVSSVAPKSD